MKASLLLLLFACGTQAFAEPTPASDAPALTQLLNEFLDGASRNDVAVHERFWADELIYTRSAGQRLGKSDIMRGVKADAAAPKPEKPETTKFTAEDVRILQYGETAVVAFRLVGTTTKADKSEVSNYFNTGTFVKRNGQWQAVAWQATKIPEDKK
jgi:ketosteroid isomerase-like protein